jgi:hypothetical protein
MYVKKNIISIFYFIRNKANSITVVKYVMNLLKKNVINLKLIICFDFNFQFEVLHYFVNILNKSLLLMIISKNKHKEIIFFEMLLLF